MVYTGRPSKACERCRERRMKCDFGRPGCQKCKNAGADCPGYRNAQDLLFKDVTGQVIKRHHTHHVPPRSGKTNSQPSTPPTPLMRALHDQQGVLAVSMTFLFKCYLQGSSFDWVQGLYDQVDSNSLFGRVVEATALAAYSQECHRKRLLAQSRIAYDITLMQLREVIATDGPITNTTLASILLMSRFETLLADGTETMVTDSWTGHIAGAFSVVDSRTDEENFADPLSLELAEQTLHNYNMWCLRARELRPDSLTRVANNMYERLDVTAANSGLRRLRIKQHQLSDGFVRSRLIFAEANVTSVRDAIASAAKIDEEVQAFCDLLAAESGFEIRPVHELQNEEKKLEIEPHSSNYHLYQSQYAARMWNNVRMLVVSVSHNLMEAAIRIQHEQAGLQDSDLKQELAVITDRCKEVISTMCDQICDSAPQFLRPGTAECTHAAASYLSWPLYLVARASPTPRARFARDALRWIGVEFNIKSAIKAVENLHDPDHYDDWLLACYMF